MLNKDIHQLEKTAIKWWPIEIQELAQQISIIPKLLATHDRFISILKLSDPNEPKSIFDVIRASNFPANVFVKHLSILTDFGGELLKRLSNTYEDIFFRNDNGKLYFKYELNGQEKFIYLKIKHSKALATISLKLMVTLFQKIML
jgi:hypothetical protein